MRILCSKLITRYILELDEAEAPRMPGVLVLHERNVR